MLSKIFDLFTPHLYSLCHLQDLVAGKPRRVANLDVKNGVVHCGASFFEREQFESLELLNVRVEREDRVIVFLALKIRLGPVFGFERQVSDEATKSLGRSLARRLGLEAPWHVGRSSVYMYDGLSTLAYGRITGSVNLSKIHFTETGAILPLGLCVEDEDHFNTHAHLLIDRRSGIVLYDALGRSQSVAEFSRLRAIESRSRMIPMHSSEHTLLTLRFVLSGPPRIELCYTYGTIHDDPIAGEVQEARRESLEVDRIVSKLRQHLLPEA